jgi:hypothetical protein
LRFIDDPFAVEEEWEWIKLLVIMKAEVKKRSGGDVGWE